MFKNGLVKMLLNRTFRTSSVMDLIARDIAVKMREFVFPEPFTDLDAMAEQRLAEIYEMGFDSVEEWFLVHSTKNHIRKDFLTDKLITLEKLEKMGMQKFYLEVG